MPKKSVANADEKDGRKLAERVAEEIEARIVRADWPVGQIIGSETALIADLGVSRGVFREAVRLVEHHGTARMRRGPGGGLVVSGPSVRAVRRAAALFLRYRRANLSTLVEARRVLELNCVEAAAVRARDPAVANRLRRTLDAEVDATTSAGSTRYLRTFHLDLADLSGNSAIALFAEILMEIQWEFVHDTGREKPNEEALRAEAITGHRDHVAIYEALIAGDADQAKARMARHLDAITRWTRPSDGVI